MPGAYARLFRRSEQTFQFYSMVLQESATESGDVSLRDRLLAVFVAVLWGCNFIAIHQALDLFPPLLLGALRFAVLAIPAILLVPRPQVPLRWLLGYGLGFGTLQFIFLFI